MAKEFFGSSCKYLVVSLKYLVGTCKLFFCFLILLLSSCTSQNTVPDFPEIKPSRNLGIGSFLEVNNSSFFTADILFIGKKEETIEVDPFIYGIITAPPLPIIRGNNHEVKKDTTTLKKDFVMDITDYNIYKNQSAELKITVDTLEVIHLKNQDVFKPIVVKSHPVWIENNSLQDTLFLPILRSHSIGLKVVHNSQESYLNSIIGCGTHSECIYLPPGHIILSSVPITKGSKRMKAFIGINSTNSNEFYLNLDPEILLN